MPSTLRKAFSTRITQLAQVIPVTANSRTLSLVVMVIPLDEGSVMWGRYPTSPDYANHRLATTFGIAATAAGAVIGTQGNHGWGKYLITGILDGGYQYVALQCGTFDGHLATIVVDEGSRNTGYSQQGFADAASTTTTRHSSNGQFNAIHVTFSVR
jgi:hypothetical protein